MQKNRVDELLQNPRKALLTLAIPIIAGISVQIMYNIADTAFVGRLGADAIAALTFSFPLFLYLLLTFLFTFLDMGIYQSALPLYLVVSYQT
jgi:Na+-driven multidrug efflux pump